ncbi:membrane protein insertion efficiency factor YidD [Tenacibaculum tangerinum]|uniref:Membrane protein insertion efficiency factor YidD n=1 Tax=Tenacibaculum tangerinum TaxID=3038772 RepID=A0ABY8L5K6_9FLAO|nr:membrane protein insertion efficiency factor YidD [Tenacibaculum tangerinum]WGH76692.1 membrane protein insertion efficiency factor YidD [Tenacibaculum tangerinum]
MMKYLLLLGIKSYWKFKPKDKPPRCIFRKSCSHYVYEETKNTGFIAGIKALMYRFKNCTYGYELYTNPVNKKKQLLLKNGEVVDEENIAKRLLY